MIHNILLPPLQLYSNHTPVTHPEESQELCFIVLLVLKSRNLILDLSDDYYGCLHAGTTMTPASAANLKLGTGCDIR
jgi:hypothetical protein